MDAGNKNKRGRGTILFFIIIFGLFGCFFKNDNFNSESETKYNSETEEATTGNTEGAEKVSNTDTFIDDLSKYLDKDSSTFIYNIYINDLGFDSLEFVEPLSSSNNYKVIANGYTTCLTAMNDGYCRIFIPDSSFVFYEDGNVILTYEQMKDLIIEPADMVYYYSIAQIIVEDCLKSPKSADFPKSSEISYQKKGNLIAIQGYVDAENSFGAEIRSNYVVQFYVYDLENLSYEVTYIEIDGEKTGEFIPYE